ncbi:MAG: alanine racemase [Proteobacteria bacterium]|nr:alanine racemase [Pseudomonadota bacterium]
MTRATRADINLDALRHNLAEIRKRAPGSRVLAVIKANAYGHGIEPVSRALREADAFAVACIDEAMRVRDAGITNPVVLLEGVFTPEEQAQAAANNFEIVVHCARQLEWLRHYSGAPLRVWLKLDSGMNRLGFKPEDFRAAWDALRALKCVSDTPRFMTHLAKADERDAEFTGRQIQVFDEITSVLPGERSIANSAGTLAFPESHRDWVRPGGLLYGVSPLVDSNGLDEGLLPVMTVSTELIAVKNLREGESIGYGGQWCAPKSMAYGIAAVGYGDGYPRHAPSGTIVLVNNQRAQLIGRVSMDMIAIDLREQPNAKPGDPVVLWGRGLPLEELADSSGTITYELLCRVTQRVNFALHSEEPENRKRP